MISINLEVEKGTGTLIGNSLRQVALSGVSCWKPIAFSINRDFNLISASPSIVEDTYKIMSGLARLNYSPKGESLDGDILSDSINFLGTLKPKEIDSKHFQVHGDDFTILTCLDGAPVELRLIYRFGSGAFTGSENSEFLEEKGESPKDFFVTSSRHTNLTKFAFDVDESTLRDILTISLESKLGDEKEILTDSLAKLQKFFTNVSNQLGDGLFQTT